MVATLGDYILWKVKGKYSCLTSATFSGSFSLEISLLF
jgi:hypothetical protein